jgi:uncharacterized protein involved in exopolysaccharide biosynthesis
MAEPPIPVVTPLRLLNAVLRQRSWMIGGALALATLVCAYAGFRPARYTSTAAIIPQARKDASSLSGLASQLGLALPTTEGGTQQPAFYVEALTSGEILRRVASTPLPPHTVEEPGVRTLADYYEGDERNKAIALERTVVRMRKLIGVSLSTKTGIVYTSVTGPSPQLAQAINRALLQQVDSFNRANRRGQAGAERQFAEARVNEATAELRVAENRLQSFLEVNRQYRNSPILTFEQDRLARDVSTKQQLYTTLVQTYEQARVQEVRDTPVFSMLEAPTFPPRADSRHIIRNGSVALLVGALLGWMLGSIVSASKQSPEFSSDVEEFRRLKGSLGRVGGSKATPNA